MLFRSLHLMTSRLEPIYFDVTHERTRTVTKSLTSYGLYRSASWAYIQSVRSPARFRGPVADALTDHETRYTREVN